MRSITITALNKYRKFASHDRKITDEVLKVKLNCLIDATDENHMTINGRTKIYTFGSCSFITVDNIIKDIRWSTDKTVPDISEVRKMITLFIRNGLNKKGNKFVENG